MEAYTEAEITESLLALIAWAGNANAAVRYLNSEGKRAPAVATLTEWSRTKHLEKFNDLREKYSAKLEADLAHEMRDIARLAVEAQRLAIQRTKERLEAGKEPDPARAGANLATMASKNTDKLMSLTGRPTQITESRDATEILRSLIARHPHLFSLTPEVPDAQIEAGTDDRSADG